MDAIVGTGKSGRAGKIPEKLKHFLNRTVPTDSSLAQLLALLRNERGLKQTGLGISDRTVRNIESGLIPKHNTLSRVAEKLSTDPDEQNQIKERLIACAIEDRRKRAVSGQETELVDSYATTVDEVLRRIVCNDSCRATDLRDFLKHLMTHFNGFDSVRPASILTAFVDAPARHGVAHLKAQAIEIRDHGKIAKVKVKFRPRSVGLMRQSVFHLCKGEMRFISEIADRGSCVPVWLEGGENTLLVLTMYPGYIVPVGGNPSAKEHRTWNAVEVGDYTHQGLIEYRFVIASPNEVQIRDRLRIYGKADDPMFDQAEAPNPMSEIVQRDTFERLSSLIKIASSARDLPFDKAEGYNLTRSDFHRPPYDDIFDLFLKDGRKRILKWTSDHQKAQADDVFYITSTRR